MVRGYLALHCGCWLSPRTTTRISRKGHKTVIKSKIQNQEQIICNPREATDPDLPVCLTTRLKSKVTTGVVAPWAAMTKPTMWIPIGQLMYDWDVNGKRKEKHDLGYLKVLYVF